MIIKALSIHQPWANLIASGSKWVENRTWQTPYRGPIAIAASRGSRYLTKEHLAMYPTGCVVAVATLAACVPLSEADSRFCDQSAIPGSNRSWSDVARHEFSEGPWCWVLDDVTALAVPCPAKGAQGLWNWEVPDALLSHDLPICLRKSRP